MTFAAPQSVVSGSPYDVIEVAGRAAEDLNDFTGNTEFIIEGRGEQHRVCGIGARHDDSVKFHEKDVAHDGKDVRVWQITFGPDHFMAEHAAAI
jgi:hypothetical protein